MGVIGKSWADEVDDEEAEEKQHQEEVLEQIRQSTPPPAPHRTPAATEPDSWRRRTAPQPTITPLHRGIGTPPPPPPPPSSFQPKQLLTHSGPVAASAHRGLSGGGAGDPGHGSEQGRAASSGGAGPSNGGNGAGSGAAGLPPGLQEAVTAACQELIQPYCKAMVQVLHQLMAAVPMQLPKAIAAAAASNGHGGTAISTSDLQRALLISMAPLQEQVAQLQKALAHVVAVGPGQAASAPAPAPAPGRFHPSPLPSRPAPAATATQPAPHSPWQAPVQAAPAARPAATPPSSISAPALASAPAAAAAASTAGLSFAERAQLASAEKQGIRRPSSGSGAHEGVSEEPEDDDDYGAPKHTRAQKVKTGFQTYKTPVRRHD